MNRQEELLTGEGKRVGDSRADGSSAIGDGGQAAVSACFSVFQFPLERFNLLNL